MKNILIIFLLSFMCIAWSQEEVCIQESDSLIEKPFEELQAILSCVPYKTGERKIFRRTSKAPFASDYVIEKTEDGYAGFLNIKFDVESGIDEDAFRNKVNTCLNEAGAIMKGPDGESLKIHYLNSKEIEAKFKPEERPGITNIEVKNDQPNIHARSFDVNSNCATLVHESLHHFGLCDEYDPKLSPNANDSTCRVHFNEPSIMKIAGVSYPLAFSQDMTCSCESQTCKSIMNSRDEKLKKIYLAPNYMQILGSDITKHCQEISSNLGSLNDLNFRVINIGPSLLDFETKTVDRMNSSPFYQIKIKKISCRCPHADSPDCGFLKRSIQNAASEDLQPIGCPFATGSAPNAIKGEHGVVKNNILTLRIGPQLNNFLRKNQFNRVINPDCGGGRQYQECAELAYIKLEDPKCRPEVRKKCQDYKYFIGE